MAWVRNDFRCQLHHGLSTTIATFPPVYANGTHPFTHLTPPPIAHPVFALRQLSNHLRDILDYEDGERDLCLLHHIFQVELHDGREQRITSTLAAYGDPMGTPGAHNAMAKTVRTVEQS